MTRQEQLNLSWAAGILEGEGSVHIHRQKQASRDLHNYCLTLAVAMCDRDVVQAFARAALPDTGRRVVERDARKETKKRLYMWQVTSVQAKLALERLLPFVRGIRMQKRIDLALEFQAQKRVGGNNQPGYTARQHAYYEQMKELNVKGPLNPLYLLAQTS